MARDALTLELDHGATNEQTRRGIRTTKASWSATVRIHYEVYGSGERRSSCCPRGRSSTRATGRRRSRTCRAIAAWSPLTAGQRPSGPPGRAGGLCRAGVRRRRARRARPRRTRERRHRRVLPRRAARAPSRRRAPGTRRERRLHRAGRGRSEASRSACARCIPSRTCSTPRRGGRSTTATTGCATIAASSSSSSRRCSTSRTRRSRSRTASAGGSSRRQRCSSRRTSPGAGPDEQRGAAAKVSCPVLVIHGDQDAIISVTRGVALAEATGGELVVLEAPGHGPHARDPGEGQPASCATSLPAGSESLDPGPRAPQARAVHLVPDRPRPRAARRRDRPTSCGSSTPTSRSTGSRSIP